jgi:class 3 adenylate cyclase/pimeloyl-ACP methyl ester carboxylesterase
MAPQPEVQGFTSASCNDVDRASTTRLGSANYAAVAEVPPTRFAKLGDDRIAYQVLGDGPLDLLWVPGIGDALDIRWEYAPYAGFLLRLASFSRLIMLDRRGMGASDPLPLDALPSWEEFADDALAVLDAVGSERTVLLAVNDAGPVAILFAATRPERTHSLILFQPVVVGQPGAPVNMSEEEMEALLAVLTENWGTEEGAAAGVPDLADDPVLVRFHAKNMRMSCSPRQAAAYIRQNQHVDLSHVLSAVTVPTLLLHRQEPSPFIPIDDSRYLAAQIPGAEVVVVPGKGLNIYTKPYAQILDRIEAFVTGTSPASDTNRALATILFTDIIGSTDRAASLGDRRWRGLLESHDAIAHSIVEQHGGRLVKLTGDGLLATFDGPGRAIRCASAFREALAPLGIGIRAGLHTGEVELRGDDIGGIAVHLAARVLEQAGPGELLTSSAVPLLVAGSGLEFEDRGEHELKGVPGTHRLYAVEN